MDKPTSEQHPTTAQKLGVLLVNTGSPEAPTPEAVRDYLQRFLSDPRIAPMPPVFWNIILKTFILGKRSRASAEKYAAIWTGEGSPLDVVHRSLVHKLNEHFRETNRNIETAYAMSYSSPFISDGLQTLKDKGCASILVLPLYPQAAFSTVGVVEDHLHEALEAADWSLPAVLAKPYFDNPRYIEALVQSITASGFSVKGNDRLLLSFHSIPVKDVNAGDTYVDQAYSTVAALTDRLGVTSDRVWTVFQSRFDKGRSWTGPFLRQTLHEWANSGVQERIFILCPNFSVDCLETLNEIQNDIIPAFDNANAAHGGRGTISYIPCLNDSDDAVAVIESVIDEAL